MRQACERSVVAVFGSNGAEAGGQAYERARAVGRELAEMGYAVANGGYGGTMEASARGAKEAGGATIGVTCSLWSTSANRYIDEVIVTRSLPERIETLIALGRCGYVVLPGATGTLAELAWVWELACKGFLENMRDTANSHGVAKMPQAVVAQEVTKMPKRPIVCMGRFWRPVIEMMVAARPASGACVSLADSPAELQKYFAPA